MNALLQLQGPSSKQLRQQKRRARTAIVLAIALAGPTAHQSAATEFERIDGPLSAPTDRRFDNSRFWTPAGSPRKGDVANVNISHNIPLLRNTESLATLRMSNGSRLNTNENVLTVRDGLGIVDLNESRLTVSPNMNRSEPEVPFRTGKPGVDATRLELTGSTLRLDDGFVRLNGDDAIGGGKMIMDTRTLVSGHGTIIINGSNTVLENQGGRISASGGLLRMDSELGKFAIDSDAVLDATDGESELRLDAPLASPFDGTMNIGGGNRIAFSGPLEISDTSTVHHGDNSSDNGVLGSGAGRLFAQTVMHRGTLNMSNGILSTGIYTQFADANLLVEGNETSDIIASRIGLTGTTTVNSELILDGDTTVHDSAVVNGTGTLIFQQGHEFNGRSEGGMSFEVPVVSNGILSPGISCLLVEGCETASLDFESLSLGSFSVLDLSIEGTDPADFDRVVSDEMSIDGALNVTLNFSPSVGDRFQIIDGQSTQGEFVRMNVFHDPDDTNFYGLVYEGDDVFFEVLPPDFRALAAFDFSGDGRLDASDMDLLNEAVVQGDLAFDLTADGIVDAADRSFWVDSKGTFFGDADLNGSVEFADFLALSNGFGTEGGWASGDFDGSGDVAFADFLLLSQNFGRSAQASAAAVPEPTAGMMLIFGLLGLIGYRRK